MKSGSIWSSMVVVTVLALGLCGCEGSDEEDSNAETTPGDQIESSDWILGTWVGPVSGGNNGSSVTFIFSGGGALSVGPTEGSGAGSYSVSGSNVSGSFDAGDFGPDGSGPLVMTQFNAQRNGNILSGNWSDSSGSGTFSVTKQ